MDEDMKQIRFTIPGQPFGKQRPKFSRAGAYVKTYTPKETTGYENLVKLFYNEAAKGKMFPEPAEETPSEENNGEPGDTPAEEPNEEEPEDITDDILGDADTEGYDYEDPEE